MNAGDAAKAIERIVEGGGTKAYRARKLFDLGCDRTDVTELLGMSYSQAHSIWRDGDYGDNRPASSNRGNKGSLRPVRDDDEADHRSTDDGVPRAKAGRREPLHLSPHQTRYITQDGHIIVRVDKDSGPVCRKCDRRLTFSLRYLGFVHTDSTAEPTDMEDRYE